MPQLDPVKALFAAQLFWFFVSFAILYVCVAFYITPRIETVLARRKSQISSDMETAQQLHASTQDIIAGYEAKIAAAKKQMTEDTEQARVKITQDAEARKAAHAEKVNAQLQQSETKLAAQRDEALASIQDVALELTGDLVQKISGIKETAKSISAAVKAVG